MTLIMGIDTGGTFTDGVVVDPARKKVLCKSKVLTVKHDLMTSIRQCMESLLECNTQEVSMVCLSTTLATNAIVEGRHGKVGLLLMGGRPKGKLPADICIQLQGKVDIKGKEEERIDEWEVLRAIAHLKDRVDAVAISGYASVRNPSQELLVKKMIREQLALPVVCAHELTSQLGYYERTVTAALNAGLIPIIGELVGAMKKVLTAKGMNVPIMIVRGDGSLMQESFALDKPIETILSGPSASVIGAVFLTDIKNAYILDMGGTTTDIAKVSDGRVKIRNAGARIGGWSPQIQAADICTFGIGGDSYLRISSGGELKLGPEKVKPLCAASIEYPYLIHELETETDCFALVRVPENEKLNRLEEEMIQILRERAHSLLFLAGALKKAPEELDLERLINRDIVQRIAMTPTDILHALGRYHQWDGQISRIGTEIMAKKLGKSAADFLETAEALITHQVFDACRQSITNFRENTEEEEKIPELPLIAIGAPVRAWIPKVSDNLHKKLIIPPHAEVANAIGAAAGRIIETIEVLVRPGKEHVGYILHSPWEYRQFPTLAEAVDYAVPVTREYVLDLAERAGSDGVEVTESQEDIYINDYNHNAKIYIETRIRATAIGNPKWRPL